MSGLFNALQSLNVQVATSAGTFGVRNGQPIVNVAGAAPQLPETSPLMSGQYPPGSGIGGWIKAHPGTAAGIGAAIILIIVAAMRR